jgi:hypothetical protein
MGVKLMKKNTDPDYLNEQYFEDWSADPQVTEATQEERLDNDDIDGPENSSCGDDY